MFEAKVPAWQERFGWFWFNAKEIYRFTDEQLEEKVKSYADMGITTLIGFTTAHFRFTFMAYKDKIHECIRKIVAYCHKYGMRYVEHHSSALHYSPKNEADWEEFCNDLTQRGDSPEDWPGLFDSVKGDPVIGGYRYSEMSQITGATGEIDLTRYAARVMCRNNPKYREVYFKYLEEMYALGVDGIMNDEVQWFGLDDKGRSNACTCEYCRAQFKEMYGYDLPQPEDWDAFYGDYSNPVFVAWKQFKLKSNERFVRDVNRHFESLGLKLMRPNYISDIISNNITSLPFEECADVWDFVFQENWSATVISASFPSYAVEAIHRNAMGVGRTCPSMSMFYPYNASNLYFSWALAKSWGQLYNQTSPEQIGIDHLEAVYRTFEKDHAAFLASPRRYADFAFLYSPGTRDYAPDHSHIERFSAALQGAYLSGFGTDLVFESAPLSRLADYPMLICVENALLSDSTLENLAAYAAQGGRLAIIGTFAKYDSTGALRGEADVKAFFGDWDRLVSEGRIRILPADSCLDKKQPYISAFHYARGTAQSPSAPYVVDQMRETTGKTLLSVVGRKKLECAASADVLASAFDTEGGIAVHLVNITDILAKNGELVAHFDIIKPFEEGAEPCPDVALSLETSREIHSAVAYTPEKAGGIALAFACEDGRVNLTVPCGVFSGYCMIELK